MKRYDVECPVCGAVNHSLFLEETDGWFECEICRTATRHTFPDRTVTPVMMKSEQKTAVPTAVCSEVA